MPGRAKVKPELTHNGPELSGTEDGDRAGTRQRPRKSFYFFHFFCVPTGLNSRVRRGFPKCRKFVSFFLQVRSDSSAEFIEKNRLV
jgi:hypothetical protein